MKPVRLQHGRHTSDSAVNMSWYPQDQLHISCDMKPCVEKSHVFHWYQCGFAAHMLCCQHGAVDGSAQSQWPPPLTTHRVMFGDNDPDIMPGYTTALMPVYRKN